MLFAPKVDQRLRQPTALAEAAVNAGVAGGAEGDEQFLPMNAGKTMMHGEAGVVRLPCPASPTPATVASENGFPVSIEAAPGMGVGPVARLFVPIPPKRSN